MDEIEEEVIQEDIVEQCPPGQEKDEFGECVDVNNQPIPFSPPENFGTPITTSADIEVVKQDIKTKIQDKNPERQEWGMFESIIAADATGYIDKFNSSWTGKGITFEQGDVVAEKISIEKGSKLFNELVLQDETINKRLIPQAAQELQPQFDAKILELRKKYDGATSEEWVKAEEEYNTFYNDKMMESLIANPKYKRVLGAYEQIVGDEIESEFKSQKRFELGLEDNADMSEGWKKFKKNLNKSWIGLGLLATASSKEETNLINLIEAKISSGELDENMSYGDLNSEIVDQLEIKKAGQKLNDKLRDKTLKEVVDKMKSRTDNRSKGTLRRLGKIDDINTDLEFFKKAEIFDEDGLTFDEFQMMIAEQIPQLALSLLPYGIGVMGQEAGGNYVDNLYAAARQEFNLKDGEKPSEEQLLQIISEGKDNKGIAIVSGIVSGQLERLGAKKVLSASLGGTKAIGSLLRGEFKASLRAAGTTTVEAIKSGMWESVTETGQTGVSQLGQTVTGGKNSFNFSEILESAGQGALLGTVFPLGGGIARQSMTEFQNTAAIVAGKFDREATENYFKKIETSIKKDGRLTEETRRQRIIALGNVRSANMKVPKNMGGQKKTDAIKLLVEQQQIKNQYEGVDINLIPESVKQRSKDIGTDLKELAFDDFMADPKRKAKADAKAEEARVTREEDTRTVEQIVDQDQDFKKFKVEKNKTLNELQDIGGKSFSKNDPGFIEDGTIYLNPEYKGGAVKTSSHELLHGIVFNGVETKLITQQGMKDWMQTNLSQSQRDKVNNLIEAGGYNKLKVGPDQKSYLEVRPDEYITQIYESGVIDQPGMFEKVKVLIQDFLNKFAGQDKFTFANKDDLTNFLREYQTNIKDGKLSQKLKNSDYYNPTGKGKAFSKEDKTLFQAIDKIVPLGTTKDQYSKVNINEAFNATMPGNVISNYISSKSTSPQQFTENIAAIRDRLANFNPDAQRKNNKNSTPIQFSEFVVANTNFSKLVANKKLAIEADKKAQEDRIDDGTLQIANPKSTSSSKPEIDKRVIYPDAVLPKANEFSDNFLIDTKFNLSTLSTEELSNLTYKTSKIIAPQAFADIWGLPLKVITQSNFNLSDIKNIRRVQSWIRTNADNLIKLLPEGNTSVKESDSKRKNKDGTFKKIKRGGESLALPDNIRDNPIFYTQLFKADGTPLKIDSETLNAKGKSKSKSNQYRKRPDITRSQFLNVFGVTNNKSDKQFDVRESEAQSIKGLLEIVGRNITNYYAEQDLDTRPDISASKKAISKVKMRDGASKIAFSKEFNKKFTDEVNAEIKLFNPLFISKPYYDFASIYDYKKYAYGSIAADNYAADFLNYGTEFFPIEFLKATSFASGLEKYRFANKMPFFSDKNNKNSRGNFWKFRKEFAKEIARRKKEGLPVATFTEKELEDIKFAMQSKDSFFDTSKSDWKLKKDQNYRGGLLIIKMFEKLNKEYPQAINMTTAWFQSAVSSTSHPWRQIAFPRLLDENYLKFQRKKIKAKKDFDNGVITEKRYNELTNKKTGLYGTIKEHMWQQNDAADFLLPNIIGQNVDATWPFIALNYYQGGIIRRNDNKLKDTEGFYGPAYNHGNVMVKPFKDSLKKAIESGNANDAIESIIRYLMPEVSNNDGGFDLNTVTFDNKSLAEIYNLQISANQINKQSIANQQLLARLIVEKTITKEKGRELLKKGVLLDPTKAKTSVVNNNILPENVAFSKGITFTNQNVLDKMAQLDSEANNARIAFSKDQDLSSDFNEIIERATGIGKEKQYGRTKARAVGADKGKFDLLGIPPSAQDFVGLTRYFAGKGKQGDATIAWIKENFLDPFARANIDISNARVALANDFKALKQLLGVSPKDLNKKIVGEPYTVGNAVRVYVWTQQGMKVPGLSNADAKILNDFVAADSNLITFANELISINKDNGYPKPGDGWLAGTITTDLLSGLNTVVRGKYLKQWQSNVNEVFNETNMNKLEAAFGKGYRDALENMLGRMKTGSNRGFKGDTLTGRFVDWLNASVGAIMFFNMRSAVLQTISAVNFVNFTDNNIFKAAAAFANQPQYWSDVVELMNSDYLVERRNGLKINVNEADIAEIAAESKNKAKAFISKLLKLGFLPTQIADSFAIASGGATFYRNRIGSLLKEGMSQKEAEAQAFLDFRETAEESQQSSRPDRISAQQAGPMGRIILAFANTPAQYARIMQKAASDIRNRRGDDKTNVSKIIYYGAIQNVIFNALQQALFAMAFGDEEPDEEKLNKKYTGIINGMADSLLRGIGFHGAAISTLKNGIMKLASGAKAQDAAIEMLDISPPISSKIGKLRSAGRTWDWNKKEIYEKGWSLDNPAWLASGQVVSAATNIPLDRGIRKLQNLKDASDGENEEWMRVANALGWQKWELEWEKPKQKKKRKTKNIRF